VSNAKADMERQTSTARSELETLTKRRDGIVAQLGQLRDFVATFSGDAGERQADEGQGEEAAAAQAADDQAADDRSDDKSGASADETEKQQSPA
jgi:hypothetical protein